jgi:hypothetical protein
MFEHMPNARIVDTVLPIAQTLFRAHGLNRKCNFSTKNKCVFSF